MKTGEREQEPLTPTIKLFPAELFKGKEIFFFALTTAATTTGADCVAKAGAGAATGAGAGTTTGAGAGGSGTLSDVDR